MRKCSVLIAQLLVLLLLGCASTSDMERFKSLKLGMNKGQVAETLGGAARSDRFNSRDYWYYTLQDSAGVPFKRLIVFEQDKIIYAGRVTNPAFVKNPNAIDKNNQRINSHVEEATELERLKSNTLPDTKYSEPIIQND